MVRINFFRTLKVKLSGRNLPSIYSRKTNVNKNTSSVAFQLALVLSPLFSFRVALKAFQSQIMEKNSSLVPIRGGTKGLELLLSPILKKLPSFDISGRFHLQVCLFDLRTHPVSPYENLSKGVTSNCLILWLSEIADNTMNLQKNFP